MPVCLEIAIGEKLLGGLMQERLIQKTIAAGAFVAALGTFSADAGLAQATPPPGRVIGRAGADLTAYAIAPVCSPRVAVTIVGSKAQLFAGGVSPAARFFGGVRAGHSLSCPQMSRMVAKGVIDGRIMFSAMADRSNDWEAVILGSNLLDTATEERLGAQSGPSDQTRITNSSAFTAADAVLKQTRVAAFLCFNQNESGCEVVSQWRSQGSAIVVINRYQLSASGTQAIVTTTANLSGGLLCADSPESRVEVEDPRISADARSDYVAQITERVRQSGRVCTGFQGAASGRMLATAFGPNGRTLSKPSSVILMATRPSLSVPR